MARIPPMEFLGPAVRQLRKAKGLTLEGIANQIDNYDSGNMSRFERSLQSIDNDKLLEVAKVLNTSVSEIYALAERLEAESKAATQPATRPLAHHASDHPGVYTPMPVLATPMQRRLQSVSEDARRPAEASASDAWEFVLIPSVVARLGIGGQCSIAIDQAAARQPVPRAVFDSLNMALDHAGLVAVKGDAMGATLADGDMALVDMGDQTIESGRVYALIVQDEIWLRRVMKTPSGFTLAADNKNGMHEDFHLSAADFRQLTVVGRVRLRWGSSGL